MSKPTISVSVLRERITDWINSSTGYHELLKITEDAVSQLEAERQKVDRLNAHIESLEKHNHNIEETLIAVNDEVAELKAKLDNLSPRDHFLAGYDDGHSRGLCMGRLYKSDDAMIVHRHTCANEYVKTIKGE